MDAIRRLIGRFFPPGAILLAILTFAGYLMGLVRDRAFARTFGAGPELDAYGAALALPEIVVNILVMAGLGAAFVPLFARLRQDDADAADRFSRTILTLSAIVAAIACAVLFVLAPQTADLVVPTYTGAQREQYIELFRLMCVTSVAFAVSFALGEMLVARQRFLSYGAAPLLYNTGIVVGTLLLGPRMGIAGAAVGTVIGSLLHLGVRVGGVLRTDASLRPLLLVRTLAVREYLRLSLPRMIAEPIESITFAWFIRVASGIAAGGVSAVSFARNFQSVPVSLVGVAFSVAAFPVLAAAVASGDRARFVRTVGVNTLTIGALTTVAGVLLLVLGERIVGIFLGGDAFDDADVALTGAILGAFALSVPLEALTHLLARAVYATRNTLLPVLASLAGLAVTVVTVELLKDGQGLVALPLSFAAGQGVKVLLLGLALLVRIRRFEAGDLDRLDGVSALEATAPTG
ncbi:MAG: lipid II flippase MurJ [Chloroflexota bacterium]